jgi:hypothetical protein
MDEELTGRDRAKPEVGRRLLPRAVEDERGQHVEQLKIEFD